MAGEERRLALPKLGHGASGRGLAPHPSCMFEALSLCENPELPSVLKVRGRGHPLVGYEQGVAVAFIELHKDPLLCRSERPRLRISSIGQFST